MSTLSSNYPDAIQVRRGTGIAWILLLGGLVVSAILVLGIVRSAANINLTPQATISQSSSASLAVPVPTPPITEIQAVPIQTPALHPGETGGPSAIPVPVPTPPEP